MVLPDVVLEDALLMTETRWCSEDSPVRRRPSAQRDRSSIFSSLLLFLEEELRRVELQLLVDSPPPLVLPSPRDDDPLPPPLVV